MSAVRLTCDTSHVNCCVSPHELARKSSHRTVFIILQKQFWFYTAGVFCFMECLGVMTEANYGMWDNAVLQHLI